MTINMRLVKNTNMIKIVVYSDKVICEYIFSYIKNLTSKGFHMIKTTMTGWALLDFSNVKNVKLEMSFYDFEMRYLVEHTKYCMGIYKEKYGLRDVDLEFEDVIPPKFECEEMVEEYYLGYTGGKDSTLCKFLLDKTNKKIVNYKVSYDDDFHQKDGHIECIIYDEALYRKFTITGLKDESDLVSLQQADDIHVTFVNPYIYPREKYGKYLVVGLPWDAIHPFSNGISDLVPTETYKSIVLLEELMHNYGFASFQVISPIAGLHTYGVYGVLNEVIGLEKILELESCWEAYHYKNRACGWCPKCQRMKRILKDCFDYTFVEDIPDLQIEDAEFLFGSVYARRLLEKMNSKKICRMLLVDEYSKKFSNEYMEILKNMFDLEAIEVPIEDYCEKYISWTEILGYLKRILGIDYSELRQDAVNQKEYPSLPFEKYYAWKRNYSILNCYGLLEYYDDQQEIKSIRLGRDDTVLRLPNNAIFRKYMKEIKWL